jgi:ATP-dependent Lhr-like helicase
LHYDDFLGVLSYLAGEYALEHQHVYGKIWYDPETKQIGKRGRLARVIYMTNTGTIPDESYVSVMLHGTKQQIGVIDEGFLERLKKGDVFVLGGNRYEFLYVRGMKAHVRGSVNRPPTIPAWFSEMLPLSFDLANEISRFRGLIGEKFKVKKSPKEIKEFIEKWCYVDDRTARRIYDYLELQNKYVGIPSNKKIIVENYSGEKEYWVFHTLFGRKVNDALSRAFALLVGQQGGRDLEIGINDNGFFLTGEKINKERIEKVFRFLNSGNLEGVLREAIERTELFKRRFRHCATRSLMILRTYKGNRKSAGKQQFKSGFLLSAIQKLSKEFPILQETRREILEDMMDIGNGKEVLDWLKSGKMKVEFKQTDLPSPFALNLIMQGRYDLIKIEDKIQFLKRIHKKIQDKVK